MLKHEEDVIKKLESTYKQATKDVNAEIKKLKESIDKLVEADPDNATLIQSKIYQLNYQKALKKQISGYLKILKSDDVTNVEEYLNKVYEDGFYTNIYNLQKAGIPVIVPINQELLIKSINRPTAEMKFSKRLYDNIEKLKVDVIQETSRGIASGMSYADIARNIENVVAVTQRKALQIAQNEGQRVKTDARIDSMKSAQEKGADIVKTWDSTLDNHTRPHHRELDQKHAEIDENFKYSGGEVYAPKHFGIAKEDINCRCVLLSTPRWDIEDTVQKRDNITGELIEAKNYEDWLKKYHEELLKEHEAKMPKAEPKKEKPKEKVFKEFIKEEVERNKDFIKSLSKEEQDGLKEYVNGDYRYINNDILRSGKKRSGKKATIYNEHIENITNALNKNELKDDTLLYRNMKDIPLDVKNLFDDDIKGLIDRLTGNSTYHGIRENSFETLQEYMDTLKGVEFIDKGFVSTTVNRNMLRNEFGSIKCTIKAPKGTHGTYVESISTHPHEKEFLLQRDSHFKISEVIVKKGDERITYKRGQAINTGWFDGKIEIVLEVVKNE